MARKRPKLELKKGKPRARRDLSQLFSAETDIEQSAGMQLLALRLDSIFPDPQQPRQTFAQASLQELAESISQDGVIQPIEVIQTAPGEYRLVHGERRWRASKIAGKTTIPAVVRRSEYKDVTRFVRQMVENIQREDLNDIDRAIGLVQLRDLMQQEAAKEARNNKPAKTSWAKVGERLGQSRQRIHQLIQLLKLAPELQEAVRYSKLSERDARIFQGLPTSHQVDLLNLHHQGISKTDLKLIVQLLKESPDLNVQNAVLRLSHLDTPPVTASKKSESRSASPKSSLKILRQFSKKLDTIELNAKTVSQLTDIYNQIGEILADLHP